MIDLKQIVKTRWNNHTKAWYENKGYVFTKYNDILFVKAEDLTFGSEATIQAQCDYCNEIVETKFCNYVSSTKQFTEKYCCSNCKGIKAHEKNYHPEIYYQKYIHACIDKGYEPLSKLNEYNDKNSILRIKCPKHGTQFSSYNACVNGMVCPECASEARISWIKYSADDIKRIVESKNNDIILNPEEYVDVTTNNLNIVCGSCGEVFMTSLVSILHGSGMCKKCASIKRGLNDRLSKEEVKNRIEKSGENILLNPDDYQGNGLINLRILCPCGNEFVTSLCNYERGKTRCNKCTQSQSIGEYRVQLILDKYQINYIAEHSFKDCRDINALPFDFYLSDFNCCIEFDGQQHFEPIFGEKSYKLTVYHDQIKNEYCKNNNIKLIRIPYWLGSKIEDILVEELNLNKIKLIKYPIK